jgi:small subunit ribosomal protein S6
MKHYEMLYLFPAKYTEEELSPLIEKVQGLLLKYEAEITFNQLLGRRKLAYPINKFYTGYYYVCEFDMAPENLQKIEKELRLAPEVLRHQIISKDKVSTGLPENLTRETPLVPLTEETTPVAPPKAKPAANISLTDLDKKIEEILDEKIV